MALLDCKREFSFTAYLEDQMGEARTPKWMLQVLLWMVDLLSCTSVRRASRRLLGIAPRQEV